MIWFVADLHLGDSRLHLFPRPFKSEYQMWNTIRKNWDELVDDTDVVYVIGDVAMHLEWLDEIKKLNGIKHLIKGNYDTFEDDLYKQYFASVQDNLRLTINNKMDEGPEELQLNLDHYPSRGIPDAFNLVGHIHGQWRVQKNMLNCALDCHNFCPISADQVFFFFNAICKYYDEDVWVGNHPANLAHNERGKEGTYYQKVLVKS